MCWIRPKRQIIRLQPNRISRSELSLTQSLSENQIGLDFSGKPTPKVSIFVDGTLRESHHDIGFLKAQEAAATRLSESAVKVMRRWF